MIKDPSAKRPDKRRSGRKAARPASRKGIASKILQTRKELAITQAELAIRLTNALPDSPTSHTTVVAWETGRRQPSPKKVVALAVVAPSGELKDYFLSHAGVTDALVNQYAKLATSRSSAPGETVTILSCSTGREGDRASGLSFSLPPQFAPPSESSHFIVTDRTLGPPFSAGDVIFLDNSRTEAPTIAPFLGEIVLVAFSRAEGNAAASTRLWDHLIGKLVLRGRSDGTGAGMSWSVRVVAWTPPDWDPWPHEPVVEFEVGQHRTIAAFRQGELQKILLAPPDERDSLQRQLLRRAKERAAWECSLNREFRIMGRVTGWLQLLRHGGS